MQPSSLVRVRYAPRVALLACPFCREMFEQGEASTCPVCGMELAPFEKLPPSLDALAEDPTQVPTLPEHEKLPWKDLGRGKGAITAVALAGLVCFCLPWVHLTLPYVEDKSGFLLSRERLGWLWAVGVAWFVLVPTVLSRRTIAQLRGARVAAAFLAAIPAISVGILLARPPRGGIIPVRYTWGWPLWATLALSLVALVAAARLGGRADVIAVRRGSSRGQTLH